MRFARVSESQKMVIIYQIIYWTINVFYSIHGERENSWMNATLLKERERERGKLKKWLFVTFVWYSLTNLFKSEQIYKKVQKVVNHFWSFYTLSHTLFCTHTHIFSHSLTCTHTHSHFLSLSHSHTHTHSESFFLVGSFSWRMQWKSELGYFLNSSQRVASSTPWLFFRRHLSGR